MTDVTKWQKWTHGNSANEETNIFNRKSMWCEVDRVDEKYGEFLRPHSTPYFSRLRPFFSYEIKSLDSLNQFTHVLLRDGLVFLLKFFQRFPDPGHLQTILLCHKDLAWVVPESWQGQFQYYERVQQLDSHLVSSENGVVKNLLILDLHSLDEFRENLEKKILPFKGEKIELLSFYNIMRGEDIDNYDRAEILEFKEELSKHFSSIENISWSELQGGSHYHFLNLNEEGVFYRDSFVSHTLLSSGAKDIRARKVETLEGGDLVSVSPYHSFFISDKAEENNDSKAKRDQLFKILKFPSGDMFLSEPQIDRAVEDYFKINYYSEPFLKLCQYLNSLP